MATSPIPTPAQALLNLISPYPVAPTPTDAEADKAISDFLAEISALDRKHNRGKNISKQQIAEQIFGRRRAFKDRRAAIPYLRYNLRAALEELNDLLSEMRNQNNGNITFSSVNQFSKIIRDYLFDLLEILTPLQKGVAGWTFFSGEKNSNVSSWEVFVLARGLAFQSSWTGPGVALDHKAAQIASIAVLRQAMELRFERLIAVYPEDKNGKPPKLRHGFHQEFIVANPQFFDTDGFAIKALRHLYDWSSEIVHQAYQPYTWQISMALRQAGNLLRSRPKSATEAWSIYNAVEIIDVPAMQAAYEDHFLAVYGHGTWRMTRTCPEASVPNWKPEMGFTSSDFQPVLSRPSLWRRFKRRMKGWLNKV